MDINKSSCIDQGNSKMNENNPTAQDLFPDDFIRNHTDFETSDEFIAACEELMGACFSEINGVDEHFIAFIREHTDFKDFAEMFTKAAGEWVVSCFSF
jgi:hypothetical protein